MKLFHCVKVLFFIVMLSIVFDESEAGVSIVRGRSHSTDAIPSTSSGIQVEHAHSADSLGSLSSFSTNYDYVTMSRPKLATPEFKEINLNEGLPLERETVERDSFGRGRKDHEPLISGRRRVSFAPNVDVSSVSIASSHGIENLNPTRDGVFARMQSILFPATVGVGVGAAVGVGAVAAIEKFNLTRTTTNIETTTMNLVDKVDDNVDANGLLIIFK